MGEHQRAIWAAKNPKIMLSWVKETIDEKIIIGKESFSDVYTWIDAVRETKKLNI